MENLLPTLIELGGAILLAMLMWLTNYLIAHFKLKVTVQREEQIRRFWKEIVQSIEEWAARQVKEGQEKPTSLEKRNLALAIAKDSGTLLAKKSNDDLVKGLESVIAEMENVGATDRPVK